MNSVTNVYQRNAKQVDREKLILDNVDYVGRILSTMSINVTNQDDRENLKSSGILGLVEAANKYDPTLGIAFRTFAFTRIRGAIIDELRKTAPVSQHVLKQIGLVKKAYERLEPPVTPEMLAANTKMKLEQIHVCLEAMRFMKPEDWNDFSSVVHGSWKTPLTKPEHAVEKQEMKQLLTDQVQKLPDRERMVITLYYAEELNLAEIGAVLNLSESRISRLLAAAKFRLKELVRSHVQ